MPGQFDGNKATPVGIGRRMIGHLLWVVELLISSLLTVSGTFLGSGELTAALSLGRMILEGAVLVLSPAATLLGFTSFGGRLLGYRFVDNHTNQPRSSMMLAKFLIQVIFGCVTPLLGTTSYYFTYRDGQHWLNGAFNLVAVDEKTSTQTDPVPPEPVVQVVVVGGGVTAPQPVEAYAVSPSSTPAQRVAPESAFTPPAYGGPASRSTASKPQVRVPQPAAVGAGTGGAETPGFEMQRPSEFSDLDTPDPGIQSAGVLAYPPTADPVSPEPVMSPPDRVPAASVPSPTPGADVDWPISAPARGISTRILQTGSDSEARAASTRAAEPVRPPSPFTPRPFPSSSPFPPPSPTSPSQTSVFQPLVGSWAAISASPALPPVSSTHATTISPAELPTVRPAPAVRVAKAPSLVQDKTVTDEEPEVIPEAILDDGPRIKVDRPLVLGCNPLAPDAYPDARSVRVIDEIMRLSETHMVLRPVCGHTQVVDIGTTNDVYIETDQERVRIPAREP